MLSCDFCREIQGRTDTTFGGIYRGVTMSRVALQTRNFVALPTIGQLLPGSVLILPKCHRETFASLNSTEMEELPALVAAVSRKIANFGMPLFFEHGARSTTGGSCGVYHAHLHVVAIPRQVRPSDLFPEHLGAANTLIAALMSLRGVEHYLLIGDESEVKFADVKLLAHTPPSQHFRQVLHRRFKIDKPWNWRSYTKPEPDLLRTRDILGQ